MATNQRAALLVAQNAKYLGQIAEIRAFGSDFKIARDIFSVKSGSGGEISQRIVKRLETSGILSSNRMFIGGLAKTFNIL